MKGFTRENTPFPKQIVICEANSACFFVISDAECMWHLGFPSDVALN